MFGRDKTKMPEPSNALRGRDAEMPVPPAHFVNGNPLKGPWPTGFQTAMFGLGCFWGAERKLSDAGFGEITTEIVDAPTFYYAEDYHQQYLAKVPNGYCGLGGTGVSCPIGVASAD